MIVSIHTQGLQTLEQVKAFVSSNERIAFTLTDRIAAYGWMTDTLKRFPYDRCKRADKGVLRQYLRNVTGCSRAQVAHCIKQINEDGIIKDRRHAPAVPFVQRYFAEEMRLLAEMDAVHGTVSGTTTRKLCERAFKLHGDVRFLRH